MDDKFNNQYRTSSTRLPDWNYAGNGIYHVTLCTKDRIQWFGECCDGKMQLSEIGRIIERIWEGIPIVYSCVVLDRFIVMPDHLHGIIEIRGRARGAGEKRPSGPSLRAESLGSIIGQFKSIVTKLVRGMGTTNFAWQPRFYDQIIRDERMMNNVRTYIINNPNNWQKDGHQTN